MRIKKYIFVLLSISFLIRVGYCLFFGDVGISSDSIEYDGLAISLLREGVFFWDNNYSYRPPLYPLFLSLVYLIFGHSFIWVRVIQSVLGALTCLLVYLMVEKMIKKEVWAKVAGTFSAFYYGLIAMSVEVLTETLFTFLLTLSILLLMEAENEAKLWKQALGGAILGLATLTRGITLIFPFFLFIWLIFKYKFGKKFLKNYFCILVPFVFVLLPWTIRNYRIHRAFVPVNIQAGSVFWGSNNPWSKGSWVNLYNLEQTRAKVQEYLKLSELERDEAFFREGLEFLKSQNCLQLLSLGMLKIWNLLFPSVDKYDITFVFIFPFCLLGMLVLLKTNSLLYYIISNFIFSTLIFYGSPRFRGPMSPFIICFGIVGLRYLHSKTKSKNYFYIALSIWFLFNFIIFILELANFDFGIF